MSEIRDPDLRDALRPLAGEPLDDWLRIRAALPEEEGPRRPIWPWAAAAAAAGILLGVAASRLWTGPAPAREPVAGGAPTETARLVGAAGKVFVETDAGVQPLVVGDRTVLDRFVETGPESIAFFVLPGKVELRLDQGSRVALLGRRSLEFAGGRVFLQVPESSGAVHVATLEGEVVANRGAVQVSAYDDRTVVVALDGDAQFETFGGETAELDGNRMVACVQGELEKVAPVELAWDHVAWQVEMLAGCVDRREEAYLWTLTLVDALDRPEVSAHAERELRSAGPIGAVALGMGIYDMLQGRPALQKRCWLLLADVGGAESLPYLLGGPSEDDPDVRVATVRTIERITAIPSGQDATFWREAPPARRFDVLTDWRERLREF